jgi:hypothetical protein
VQPQVDVAGVDGRIGERGHGGAHDGGRHPTGGVVGGQLGEVVGELLGVGPERGRGVPRVEDRAVGCGGGEAGAGGAVGARCSAHDVDRIRGGFVQVTR